MATFEQLKNLKSFRELIAKKCETLGFDSTRSLGEKRQSCLPGDPSDSFSYLSIYLSNIVGGGLDFSKMSELKVALRHYSNKKNKLVFFMQICLF